MPTHFIHTLNPFSTYFLTFLLYSYPLFLLIPPLYTVTFSPTPRVCESDNKNAPQCASLVMGHTSLLNSLAVLTLFEHNHHCETPLYLVCFTGHPNTLNAILSSPNMIPKNDIEKQRIFLKTIGKQISYHCIVLYCIVLYCIVMYCIVLYCTVLHCILFIFFLIFSYANTPSSHNVM